MNLSSPGSFTWFFRSVLILPVAYTILAFLLGYLISKGPLDTESKFSLLLTLLISSSAVMITITTIAIHYWVTWKIKIRKIELDSGALPNGDSIVKPPSEADNES